MQSSFHLLPGNTSVGVSVSLSLCTDFGMRFHLMIIKQARQFAVCVCENESERVGGKKKEGGLFIASVLQPCDDVCIE